MRSDETIENETAERLEKLLYTGNVPKPHEIKSILFSSESEVGVMIRINGIHIEEFRGIRDLSLNLENKNFGICGPNGSGKSGVVDAIEFCITGDITRLSGAGSADLSVKQHAPHVDQYQHPERAKVTITADIPVLNKSVILQRNVKNPRKLSITP